MAQNQEIQKKKEGEIQQIPAHLQLGKGEELGTEGMGASDIQIARVKICQGLSEIKKENSDIVDGDIYSSLGDGYGKKLDFFVLRIWRSIVWFSEDKKMICTRYIDPDTHQPVFFGNQPEVANYSKEQLAKQNIKVVDSHNYIIIPEKSLVNALKKGEMPFPAIYSGMSSAIKFCRQLNGKLNTNGLKRMPIYAQLVTMKTQMDTFKKGSAYMPRFTYGRYAEPEEFNLLKELAKSSKALLQRTEVTQVDIDTADIPGEPDDHEGSDSIFPE